MDVLSDVIASVRSGRPHASRTAWRAPWGAWFHASSAAGFHVMLGGAAWLIPQDGDPIALGVGDVVFAARGVAHGLADSPSSPMEPSNPVLLNAIAPADDTEHASAVMLCGAYQIDSAPVASAAGRAARHRPPARPARPRRATAKRDRPPRRRDGTPRSRRGRRHARSTGHAAGVPSSRLV
jgi:hypothetical protein